MMENTETGEQVWTEVLCELYIQRCCNKINVLIKGHNVLELYKLMNF